MALTPRGATGPRPPTDHRERALAAAASRRPSPPSTHGEHGPSGRVVTAAAVIMTGVFAAFLLNPDPVIKPIGLSLAFGVLADAFIVRMPLVPAVMALLGDRAWKLPRRLGRIVPNVDIEGEQLMHGLRPSTGAR